ncbi:MAG: cytochrome c [Lysobacterales bacterium]|nr:MAG: cytochrome c [Xanthomonadales bacterium]
MVPNGKKSVVLAVLSSFLLPVCSALAAESPQEQRHELMEDVGGGAKTIGKMLEGEEAFDAVAALSALQTWNHAAGVFGDLFPAGSDSGYDTEAKATIWSDRAGFDAALQAWAEAVDAAIAANPQDLGSLEAAAGPVFEKCKACHEDYRVEKE